MTHADIVTYHMRHSSSKKMRLICIQIYAYSSRFCAADSFRHSDSRFTAYERLAPEIVQIKALFIIINVFTKQKLEPIEVIFRGWSKNSKKVFIEIPFSWLFLFSIEVVCFTTTFTRPQNWRLFSLLLSVANIAQDLSMGKLGNGVKKNYKSYGQWKQRELLT